MVLSHSRKGYSEVMLRQTAEDFLRALENAFEHFGGVPRTIVTDNLKAAVLKADWFDPELNPKLAAFAEHYGTVVLPTRRTRPGTRARSSAALATCRTTPSRGGRSPVWRRRTTSSSNGSRHGRHAHPRHDAPAGGEDLP
ncbi:MAG: DDE-type integrase/transposase/recombinase [Planctomycetia bacterium]|nr:DDE-type integrase/transposase/recombinase [Planctomycetia bacterium]